MALEKLTITPFSQEGERKSTEAVAVLFNPKSYSISKGVTWQPPGKPGEVSETDRKSNAPVLTFGGGASRQLTLKLFFDVTETSFDFMGASLPRDVRWETDKIVQLTLIDKDGKRPPTCEVSWGGNSSIDFPFIGVISSLSQEFVLFDNEGRPLRANLDVSFTEWNEPRFNARKAPDLTTQVLKAGYTLSRLAADAYQDATQWRRIAEANHLDDPRQLPVGLSLTIPKLR